MKSKILIPLIFYFCSCILYAQNDFQSLLDKKFQVIQIEGFDSNLSEHRTHNQEMINTFKNPLIINFHKSSPWRSHDFIEYEYVLGTKVVNSIIMYFNFEEEIIKAKKMGPSTRIGIQSKKYK